MGEIIVRAVPRSVGTPAETEAHTFHGVLVAPARRLDAVRQFCARHAGDAGGLPTPRGLAEELFGMHLCAVHVEERRLGPAVSLFGTEGLAG